ncbi:MAG: hypothetical protein PHG12_11335, partial [Sphaerochaeta sp.]|nr:hypothetical protein [Sphaerochaeta sp.]
PATACFVACVVQIRGTTQPSFKSAFPWTKMYVLGESEYVLPSGDCPIIIGATFPNSRCSQEKGKSQGEFLGSLCSKSQIRTMRAIGL